VRARQRLLVTGSRDWDRSDVIWAALTAAVSYPPLADDLTSVVLVSGACPTGADAIAEEIWTLWGRPVERHPAQWRTADGVVDKGAGFRRNADMVKSLDPRYDTCLVFSKGQSRGTAHTMGLAHAAGITTIIHVYEEQ
jgi:hypothetical protein